MSTELLPAEVATMRLRVIAIANLIEVCEGPILLLLRHPRSKLLIAASYSCCFSSSSTVREGTAEAHTRQDRSNATSYISRCPIPRCMRRPMEAPYEAYSLLHGLNGVAFYSILPITTLH